MEKKSFRYVFLIILSLFFLISPAKIFAQEFNCSRTLSPPIQCFTSSNCPLGWEARFPDGSTCEDKTVDECVALSGSQNCIPPAGTDPVCYPNERRCEGPVLKQCNDTGTELVQIQDCSTNGGICEPFGTSNARCSTPINTDTGTGDTGTGQAGNSIVNLTALINTISPNFRFGSNSKLGNIVGVLLPFLYTIAGIALLVFMIRAGFMYLTSAGDAKKMEQAKGALTAAVIGFIIIFVSFWITQIVNFIFKLGTGV